MAVVIGEVVTEVVLSGSSQEPAAATGPDPADALEQVVRLATERVLEHLRREWDR